MYRPVRSRTRTGDAELGRLRGTWSASRRFRKLKADSPQPQPMKEGAFASVEATAFRLLCVAKDQFEGPICHRQNEISPAGNSARGGNGDVTLFVEGFCRNGSPLYVMSCWVSINGVWKHRLLVIWPKRAGNSNGP